MSLAEQMQSAIQAVVPGTTAGIHVIDTETGTVLADLNATTPFFTASVVKLLIALDAFNTQNWRPDNNTRDRVQRMLSYSDDNVADAFWDDNGGNNIVARMVRLIGLPGTAPPADPDEWGETTITALDVATIYQYLTRTVPLSTRDPIVDALRKAARIAADGTDQYFGIPDGVAGRPWAVKQGWMSLNYETTLNTTGLVGPRLQYTVVVLTRQPAGISWSLGDPR